jgi:VWFA-related protein
MKTEQVVLSAFLAGIVWLPMGSSAQALSGLSSGQAFSGAIAAAGLGDDPGAASAPDSSQTELALLYANGTRAINEGRWSDAEAIFTKVASQHGEHADGALYWKAYAENKRGLSSAALDTCGVLRADYPRSSWIHECGALEIEIHARSGKPAEPKAGDDDDLKLLALNSLMRQDEKRALEQIREILKSDFSERFKEGAVFILSQSQSTQARELLTEISQKKIDAPHSSIDLQVEATAALQGHLSVPPGSVIGNGSRAIQLDVVVTDKSGAPVADLQPGDFKLLDNKQPQSLVSVRFVNGMTAEADPPVEAIVLVDAINATFLPVANERQWLANLFKENGGELALPTSLILLTDRGMRIQNHPSRDGKVLMQFLDSNTTGLRSIVRSEGREGALEREQASLDALSYLVLQAARKPGRKLLFWVSPGWQLFSNPSWDGGPKDEKILFNYIVSLSTALRAARMTVYSIDPAGAGRGQFYYQNYLKGVDAPKHADYGDLFLEVLATQSGGQVLFGSNDLAILIDQCIADAKAYYVLTFNPPPASHPNEYHSLEVQVDKPGLRARTRTGYYAQATAAGTQTFPKLSLQTVQGLNE